MSKPSERQSGPAQPTGGAPPMAVGLGDVETALRIARAVSQAGGRARTAQVEVAWLLGLFGASPAREAGLRRVAHALRMAGLEPLPPLPEAPPDGRLNLRLTATRFAPQGQSAAHRANGAPKEPGSPGHVEHPSAAGADAPEPSTGMPGVALGAAILPVLATVALGTPVGVVFLVLAGTALVLLTVRPALSLRVWGQPSSPMRVAAVAAALTAVSAGVGFPVAAAREGRAAEQRRQETAVIARTAAARERVRLQAEQRRQAALERSRRLAAADERRRRAVALRRRRARVARTRRERREAAAARERERERAAQAEAAPAPEQPAPVPAPSGTDPTTLSPGPGAAVGSPPATPADGAGTPSG